MIEATVCEALYFIAKCGGCGEYCMLFEDVNVVMESLRESLYCPAWGIVQMFVSRWSVR